MPLDLFKSYKPDDKPWLIVGMGPTFSEHKNYDLSQYNILAINRTVQYISCDICQIIDFYIVDKVKEDIRKNAKYLAIPYYPHFMCRPFLQLTAFYIEQYRELLRDLNEQKRLLAFNLSTMPLKVNKSPVVTANYFSAEAAVSLVANLGAKKIRTIGIDGGTVRDETFKDHGPCDSRGFDIQWAGIAETIKKYDLDYERLTGGIPDGLHKELGKVGDATEA